MTKDKLKSVLLFYKDYLKKKGSKNKSADYDKLGPTKEEARNHSMSMILRNDSPFKANKIEKAFRWLSFIQGVLWVTGVLTLNQLKNHSRSYNNK